MGRSGTEFKTLLGFDPATGQPLSGKDGKPIPEPIGEKREALLRQALDAGEFPDWVLNAMQPVVVAMTINGTPHELTYFVSPDNLAVGTNNDFLRVRPWPSTFQWFADKHGLILPTSRMSDQIFEAAPFKVRPNPITPHSASSSSWLRSDAAIAAQAAAIGYVPGVGILGGHMKDVVNGPGLSGDKVAIYGWHDPSGTVIPGRKGPIQDYSTIHHATFSDYSHGARLVRRKGILDGHEVDLGKIMTDPVLYPLLSKRPGEGVSGEGGPLTNDRFPVSNTNSPNILMSLLEEEVPGTPAYATYDTPTSDSPPGASAAPAAAAAVPSAVSFFGKIGPVGRALGCLALAGGIGFTSSKFRAMRGRP